MAFYFLVDSYIYGDCKEYEEYRKIMGKRINNVDGRAIVVEGDD